MLLKTTCPFNITAASICLVATIPQDVLQVGRPIISSAAFPKSSPTTTRTAFILCLGVRRSGCVRVLMVPEWSCRG